MNCGDRDALCGEKENADFAVSTMARRSLSTTGFP